MTSPELELEIRAYRLCAAAEPHSKIKPCDSTEPRPPSRWEMSHACDSRDRE